MRRALVLLALFAFSSAAYAARKPELPQWIRASIPLELPAVTKDAKAVVLLDHNLMHVRPSGEIETTYRRVVKILTSAGREENGYAAVSFSNQNMLKSFKAWSIDAKGNEYEVKERDAVETSSFDFELYSDVRMKVMRYPAADVGSVVAYEYTRLDRPFILESGWMFQEEIPVLRSRLELTLPAGWTYTARWRNHAEVAPIQTAPLIWEVTNLPGVAAEPRMPAKYTLAGQAGLHFLPPGTAERKWSDIARWFADLASSRTIPTPQLQAKVKELTASGDALRKLARFAQRDVRYVAVEIGIGGYQPHAAGEVFTNRYGDCKDKAALLRTMLKEVGVDALFVIVHTTRGAVDPTYASIGSFNHVISAIPLTAEQAKGLPAVVDHPKLGKLLLFDPTSTTTPFGLLPSYLQGSKGLLVTNDGGELIDMPAHAADTNQLRRTAKLQLDDKGTLSGSIEEVRTGTLAAEMRYSLQSMSSSERVRSIESGLASHLASYSVSDVAFEHIDEPEHDLVVRYRLNAPNYARRVADMLLVRPRVLGQKAERIVDLATRKYGYVTEGPSVHTDDIEIAFAPAIQLDELPANVDLKTALVQYTAASKFENQTLRYQRRYALNAFSVSKESLPELTKSFAKIMADERASAVFK
ncbi:MAG TPA: DUF3857 domain-containing protein [Thermoanaerobaculia bacterium]